jgi:ribosomal protein S18 acetylase RimI-like enzyme
MVPELRFSDNKSELDVDPLINLYQYAWWAKGRRADDVVDMVNHCGLVMMLWAGRRLIGFTRVITDFVYRATIYDVIIHPDFHDQGLGRQIMLNVLHHPTLRRVEKFWLNTSDKQEFYRKLGFVEDATTGMILNKEREVS